MYAERCNHCGHCESDNPRLPLNIDKSGFHHGQYVGYSPAGVYRIHRGQGFYRATKQDGKYDVITGDTLESISRQLSSKTKSERNTPMRRRRHRRNPELISVGLLNPRRKRRMRRRRNRGGGRSGWKSFFRKWRRKGLTAKAIGRKWRKKHRGSRRGRRYSVRVRHRRHGRRRRLCYRR